MEATGHEDEKVPFFYVGWQTTDGENHFVARFCVVWELRTGFILAKGYKI